VVRSPAATVDLHQHVLLLDDGAVAGARPLLLVEQGSEGSANK
jgi:hypothetical protein